MKFGKEFEKKFNELEMGTPTKVEGINYFDFSSVPKQISYIKDEKLDCFGGDFFNLDLRKKYATTAKAGKILKKLFPSVKDDIIRNKVSLLFGGEVEESIVETNEIVKYYNSDSYAEGYSSSTPLNNSCMRYDECEKQIRFYEELGISMLVLFHPEQTDKIIGRALLWRGAIFKDENGKEEKVNFMDRIYVDYDGDIEVFKSYAKKYDFVYKCYQNYDETSNFMRNGDKIIGTLIFDTGMEFEMKGEEKIYFGGHKWFPYTDTLMYFGVDGKLRSTQKTANEYICRGQNTEGKLYPQRYTNKWSEVIEAGDAEFSKTYDQFVNKNDLIFSKYHNSKIRKENAQDVFYKSEITPVDRTLIDKSLLVFFKGKMRLSEEIFECDKTKEKIAFEECPLFIHMKEKIEEINTLRRQKWEDYKKTNWKNNTLKIVREFRDYVDQFVPEDYKNFSYVCGSQTLFDAIKNISGEEKSFVEKFDRSDRFFLIFNSEDEIIQIGLPQGV